MALQRGQALRDARSRVQAAALRLRPLALEVFFLGTAIVSSSEASDVGAGAPDCGPSAEGGEPVADDPTRLAGPSTNRHSTLTAPRRPVTQNPGPPKSATSLLGCPQDVQSRPARIDRDLLATGLFIQPCRPHSREAVRIRTDAIFDAER